LGACFAGEPTEEEEETQRVLDWFVEHGAKGHTENANRQDEDLKGEGGD
jgi:hypothetical protein